MMLFQFFDNNSSTEDNNIEGDEEINYSPITIKSLNNRNSDHDYGFFDSFGNNKLHNSYD